MTRKWLLILAFFLLAAPACAADDLGFRAERKLDISIAKSRISWNTWKFQPIGLSGANIYLWDFGDGRLSDEPEPVHSWPRWGKYKVTLSASDSAGGVGSSEEQINVGFWHIQNFWLQAILGFLGLCAVILVLLIIFNKLPKFKD